MKSPTTLEVLRPQNTNFFSQVKKFLKVFSAKGPTVCLLLEEASLLFSVIYFESSIFSFDVGVGVGVGFLPLPVFDSFLIAMVDKTRSKNKFQNSRSLRLENLARSSLVRLFCN